MMKRISVFMSIAALFAAGIFSAQAQSTNKPATNAPAAKSDAKEVAVITTSAGEMVLGFWPDVAPKTVENFKTLAKKGYFDGTAFHRIIKDFMIQGGDPQTTNEVNKARFGTGGPGYTIPDEFNKRKHELGVISMANTGRPNSGGSQFFLCLGSNQKIGFLDEHYTGFGKLIKGEDVLLKIGETAVSPSPSGEMSVPQTRIEIKSVKIVPADSIK